MFSVTHVLRFGEGWGGGEGGGVSSVQCYTCPEVWRRVGKGRRGGVVFSVAHALGRRG